MPAASKGEVIDNITRLKAEQCMEEFAFGQINPSRSVPDGYCLAIQQAEARSKN